MKVLVTFVALCAVAFGSAIPRLDGRILGGMDVNIVDYPYEVSVRVNDQHFCGGTILDKDTILTSNFCTYNQPHDQFSIRVGNTKHANGKSYKVINIIVNPDFSINTWDNDACILKLETSLQMSNTVQPIKLHPTGVANSEQVRVSGWGIYMSGNVSLSDGLKAVDVKVISKETCEAIYGFAFMTKTMFCAQTPGRDVCFGDTGGPVVVDGMLVGMSMAVKCDDPHRPSIYANVHNMASWIESNIH